MMAQIVLEQLLHCFAGKTIRDWFKHNLCIRAKFDARFTTSCTKKQCHFYLV